LKEGLYEGVALKGRGRRGGGVTIVTLPISARGVDRGKVLICDGGSGGTRTLEKNGKYFVVVLWSKENDLVHKKRGRAEKTCGEGGIYSISGEETNRKGRLGRTRRDPRRKGYREVSKGEKDGGGKGVHPLGEKLRLGVLLAWKI